ncbi:MAG: RNA-binding cell elongation regulator Jag/EloR [Nitrospinota bacterium]
MGTLEIEGGSREEALSQGLARLGLGEEDVEVEELGGGKRLLGLLGRSAVRLRIHFEDGAERLAAARETLEAIVSAMGIETAVEARFHEGAAHLDIQSEQVGLLIGRRGETLDALEYLVDRIVNRPPNDRVRIVLDAEGYRDRNAEKLRDLAARLAERARRTGRRVACKPMNARDRRLVHMALREMDGVETFSEGEGSFRRVIISPT